MSGITLSHGAPTAIALKGALALDVSTPDVYQNTDGASTWVKLVRDGAVAALSGLTLTGFSTGILHSTGGIVGSSAIVAADIAAGAVTGAKLDGTGFSTGQVYAWNGTTFVATTLSTGTLGAVPTSRTLTATAPLTIAGGTSADLSADRTIAIGQAGASTGQPFLWSGSAWTPSTAFGSASYGSVFSFSNTLAGAASITVRNASATGFPGFEFHDQSDVAKVFIGYSNAATNHLRINALGVPIWLLISSTVVASVSANGLRIGDSTAATHALEVHGAALVDGIALANGLVTIDGSGLLGSAATITDAQHGTRAGGTLHPLASVSAAGFAPTIPGSGRVLLTTGPDASAVPAWASTIPTSNLPTVSNATAGIVPQISGADRLFASTGGGTAGTWVTAAGDWSGPPGSNVVTALTGVSSTVTVHATTFLLDNVVPGLAIVQNAAGGGVNPTAFKVVAGAHSALSGEVVDIDFALGRTKVWTGSVATQRDVLFRAATYASAVGAITITDAATVAIAGGPSAGTDVTITNSYALWVQSGATRFDGPILWNIGTGAGGTNAGDLMLALNASALKDKVWLHVGGGPVVSGATPQYYVNVDPAATVVTTATPTKLITCYLQGQGYNLGGGTKTIQQELSTLRVDAPFATSGAFAFAGGALGPLAIHAAGDVKVDGNVASTTISTPGLLVDGLGQVSLFGPLLWDATETEIGTAGTLANPDKWLLVHVSGITYKIPAFVGP